MPPVEVKSRLTRSTKLYVEHKYQKYQNQTFMKSFFPHFTKLYNNLEPATRNLNTVDFKEKLKPKYKQKKVKHFSRGLSKWSNSLHTQLRVGRSFLAADGFKINLIDSNKCQQCTAVPDFQLKPVPETASHFFLVCNNFDEKRNLLFSKIKQYVPNFQILSQKRKIEILLFGINLENEEPDPRNLGIALAVQRYIIQTERFIYGDAITTPPPPPPPPPINPPHL